MSSAPLYQALAELAGGGAARFHMPGHKGAPLGTLLDGALRVDYTEIPPTGNLYGEDGVIQRAEALCAGYYGMDRCLFLTCGATQGVKAALALFCPPGSPVVADRNCHLSALDACVLLDLRPSYLQPVFLPEWGVTGGLSARELGKALDRTGAKAAIITSPTYYGFSLDVAALARTAHDRGAKLIVDAAHGSHLRACGQRDPAAQGADAVIFSAHKTLGAMTQGAYLLLRGLDDEGCRQARRLTALFGTTSPSYPVMASLDLARSGLESGFYQRAPALCAQARLEIEFTTPFRCLPADDPCRLSVSTAHGGVSGHACAQSLREQGVEPEMADGRNVVCIVTGADDAQSLDRLIAAFRAAAQSLPAGPLPPALPPPPIPPARLTPRQAYFAPKQAVPLDRALGRVAAQSLSPYPPGVPYVAPGEEIILLCIESLLRNGYNKDSKLSTVQL